MTTVKSEADLLGIIENIIHWSYQLMDDAPLSPTQQADVQAILNSSQRFHTFAQMEMVTILNSQNDEELQRVRHQLRNYLNIVVGFSSLLVRELPDNLLMHMVTLRNIHQAGESLMHYVNDIR